MFFVIHLKILSNQFFVKAKRTIIVDGRGISKSEMRRQRKENQAVFQLAMIVGSFVFGYIPTCGGWFVSSAFLQFGFKCFGAGIALQLYV